MRHVSVLCVFTSITLCLGIYVPPHVPMQEVAPVSEFDVPSWLGGFVAVTNETSEWVLPLTYLNGGKTNIGTTLVIQNRGPFNITLYSSDPETIQGLVSYLIVADSTVQFLSAADWVVVSATFGDEGTDGSFGYLQAGNASVACWLGVGTNNPTNKVCGDLSFGRGFGGYTQISASQITCDEDFNPCVDIFANNAVSVIASTLQVDLSTGGSTSNSNIRLIGTSTSSAGPNILWGSDCMVYRRTGSVLVHSCSEWYGNTIRFTSDAGTSASGFCSGSAGDTCMFRPQANIWTFNSGTSLRIPQYLNVGSSSAPTNTIAGAISTTISNPTLQAFGAVTANGASGLLAFTVSTAAATCATAVVTNTNVVVSSFVQLTIQSYSGTYITNGFPVVARANTAGSSAGSFTISLCNMHATNALTGNLYVSFWVLN